jgi:hypothetical protein
MVFESFLPKTVVFESLTLYLIQSFQNAVYFFHLVNLLLLLPAYGPPPFFLTICRAL